MFVYWIRKEEYTDKLTQGYIGITKDLEERFRAHKKNKRPSHFVSAINKYGWDNLVKEILYEDVTLEEALKAERELRPTENIGWNSQRGGEIGVNPEWYALQENKDRHSNATSLGTIKALLEKDSKEKRSERGFKAHRDHPESYKDASKGEKNPKAILTEEKVRQIKYELIPSGLSNKEISLIFKVKHYVISFIRTGKNWSYV